MAQRVGLRVTRRIYRDGLVRALERVGGFSIIGATESLIDLSRMTQTQHLDCVVIEVHSKELCAERAISAIHHAHPKMRIVVLHELDRYELHRLKRAGATATADRYDGISAVISAITGATPEDRCVRPTLDSMPTRFGVALTTRERQVLELVASGNTSRAISIQLAVSPKTVENHKQRIFRKLAVQNQGQAVAIALRGGLIRAIPDDMMALADGESFVGRFAAPA